MDQAYELAIAIPDYEEAAIQAGWQWDEGGSHFYRTRPGASAFEPYEYVHTPDCDWAALCLETDIEPYEREVFEHWAVSDWFGRKLREQGEKVDDDFANLTVWARTTTGQAIYCDGVVERIVADLWKPEPTPERPGDSDPVEQAEQQAEDQGWTQTPDGRWWREPDQSELERQDARLAPFLGSGPFMWAESAQAALDIDAEALALDESDVTTEG